MLFYLKYHSGDYAQDGKTASRDYLDMWIIMITVFSAGLMCMRFLALPLAVFILFWVLQLLLPYPIKPLGYHLLFIPALCFCTDYIFYICFKKGTLIGVIAITIATIVLILYWFMASRLSSDMSIYFGIDIIVLFALLFSRVFEVSSKSRFLVIMAVAGIGLAFTIYCIIQAVRKDVKIRRLLYVCSIMFILGCIPIVILAFLNISNSPTAYGWVIFSSALIVYYVVLGVIENVLAKIFDTYKVIGCAPAMVPLIASLVVSLVAHQRIKIIYDSVLSGSIRETAQSINNMRAFKSLSYLLFFPQVVGIIWRVLVYGAALYATSYVMAKGKNKSESEDNED